MTTLFSLKSIRYARFLLLGLFDLAVLAVLSLLIRKHIEISVMLTLACLLLPFLLTMMGGLLLARTAFGRNHPYSSGVPALITAAGTQGLLLPESPLARVVNNAMAVHDLAWIPEAAAALMMITVIALFCANVNKEEEMTALWNQ